MKYIKRILWWCCKLENAADATVCEACEADFYLCGGACGSMLEMTAFSKSRNSYLCTYRHYSMCRHTAL